MNINMTDINDAVILEPDIFSDDRGWFTESYSFEKYEKLGIRNNFVQDNHSYSKNKGTLRGMHFQDNPRAQSKLIRCTAGKILDVIVDMRKNSSSYLKSIKVILSKENKKQLYVPKGCAHGFVTLEDDSEIQYKVDEYYSSKHDRSIRYDDPDFDIDWGVDNLKLSKKDLDAPYYRDCKLDF